MLYAILRVVIFIIMGELYQIDNDEETVITVSDTYYSAIIGTAGTSSLTQSQQQYFETLPGATGSLKYVGPNTLMFNGGATVSFLVGNKDKEIEISLGLNGTPIQGASIRTASGATSIHISSAIHKFITLSTNDTLSFFIKNNTNTENVILTDFNLFLIAM